MANHKMNDTKLRQEMQRIEPVLTARITGEKKWEYLASKYRWNPTKSIGFTPLARYAFLRIFGFDALVDRVISLCSTAKNPGLSAYQSLRGFGKRLLKVNPAVHAAEWREVSLAEQVDLTDFEDFARQSREEYDAALDEEFGE